MEGFDYSIKPNVMIMGDVEFTNLISEAQILGLGYISIPQSIIDTSTLKIALIFNDEIKGKEVMQRFMSWIEHCDNNEDAFSFDIVEKNDNTYTLCFHQDESLLIESNIPNEIIDWICPVIMKVVHFKPMKSKSKGYYMFKEACKFRECTIYGANKEGVIFSFENKIVKRNIKFYKEDEIDESSPLRVINVGNNMTETKVKHENFHMNRMENIKYFFPVTYNEITQNRYLADIIDKLIDSWKNDIIIQAICNLILKYRMEYDGFKVENNQSNMIIDYLVNNYETPKSKKPNDSYFNIENITQQIKKDEKYYKNSIGDL